MTDNQMLIESMDCNSWIIIIGLIVIGYALIKFFKK